MDTTVSWKDRYGFPDSMSVCPINWEIIGNGTSSLASHVPKVLRRLWNALPFFFSTPAMALCRSMIVFSPGTVPKNV